MRTTLNIDDALMKQAKIRAIEEGITLTEYIERALQHESRPEAKDRGEAATPWKLTVLDLKPAPGVDLTTNTWQLLEDAEGANARP